MPDAPYRELDFAKRVELYVQGFQQQTREAGAAQEEYERLKAKGMAPVCKATGNVPPSTQEPFAAAYACMNARLLALVLLQSVVDHATRAWVSCTDSTCTLGYTVEGTDFDMIPPPIAMAEAIVDELCDMAGLHEPGSTSEWTIIFLDRPRTYRLEHDGGARDRRIVIHMPVE